MPFFVPRKFIDNQTATAKPLHPHVVVLFISSGGEIRIPSFVDSQHIYNYYLNKSGVAAARKIMGVLEVTKPDIVYCPMLYPMVCLFLHFMDASECYNCVYALLRNPAFVSQTKVSYEASKLVMRDLAKKHAVSTGDFIIYGRNVDFMMFNLMF